MEHRFLILLYFVSLVETGCSESPPQNTATSGAPETAGKVSDKDRPGGIGSPGPMTDDRAPKLLAPNCVDPDLQQIPTTVALTLCDGTLVTGAMPLISGCSSSVTSECFVSGAFKAVDLTNIQGSDIRTGTSIAGVSGTLVAESHLNCVGNAEVGCIANATFKAADLANLAAQNVKLGVQIAGTTGTLVAESHSNCVANGTIGCITTSSFKAGDFTNVTAGNIKSGISVAGVTGQYPSPTYPLSGSDGTNDLDSATFNVKIKSGTTFEYFDSAGNRYTGAGDPDIFASKILSGVSIFGEIGTVFGAIGAWNSAQLVENSTDAADLAASALPIGNQVDVDGNGVAWAVFRTFDGTRYNIKANKYISGTGWGSELLLENTTDNSDFARPNVSLNESGKGVATWVAAGKVYVAYYNGSTWAAPIVFDADTGSADMAQAKVDSFGDAVLIWQEQDGTRYNLWASEFTSGSGWSTAHKIENAAGNVTWPSLAMNDNGDAIVVWGHSTDDTFTYYDFYATSFVKGSGWLNRSIVENYASNINQPVALAALSNTGHGYVSFIANSNVYVTRRDPTGSWATNELVENVADAAINWPSISANASGDVIVGWGATKVYSVRSSPGGVWSTPQQHSAIGGATSVTYANDGRASILWKDSSLVVKADHYTSNTGWRGAFTVYVGSVGISEASMNFGHSISALAIFRDGTNVKGSFFGYP